MHRGGDGPVGAVRRRTHLGGLALTGAAWAGGDIPPPGGAELSWPVWTSTVMVPVGGVVLGYDPVWFGVMVVLLAEIGLVSPPLGLNVFIVARATRQPTEQVFRGVVPFVVAMLVLVLLFTFVPQIVLWLPGTMAG